MLYRPVVALFCLSCTSLLAAAEDITRQTHLLNALDTPNLPNIGAWKVEGLSATLADGVEPKLGLAAISLHGNAEIAGAKVDVTLANSALTDCSELSLWVSAAADSNATAVGFQVLDAKGEFLLQTIPVDWLGWKQVAINPTSGGMSQSYPQPEQNGTVDLPIKSVNVVWMTKSAGPTALIIDALLAKTLAKTPTGTDAELRITATAGDVAEPRSTLVEQLIVENQSASDKKITVAYTVQTNPRYVTPPIPDPQQGLDHALMAHSFVRIDAVDSGDAQCCDGDDNSSFSTPWGKGYKQAEVIIDLLQVRQISAVHTVPEDANWIWEVDAAVSVDGILYSPVKGCENIDLHGKWGTTILPWATPVPGRFLKLRFHHGTETTNQIRLPATIRVYDGLANDPLTIPVVGQTLMQGSSTLVVPAHGLGELTLRDTAPLTTGSYLVSLDIDFGGGRHEVRLNPRLIRPSTTVDANKSRRFGINCAEIALAPELRRCGFGWVRFENAKWQMFCESPDVMAFDGSLAPWQVNLNGIFATYQQLGMHILPYVFQTPEWATSAPPGTEKNRNGYPPKNADDYGEAIYQLVARFGRKKVDPATLRTSDKKSGLALIDAVELWNEPNLVGPEWAPFVGPMSQYFEVMRAGVAGSRRADPTLPISACGFAGIDLQVVGLLADYRYADGTTPLDAVDIINVHFYSGREEPEICGWDPNVFRDGPPPGVLTYPEQLAALVAWRDLHKPSAQIWLTETGYDVGGPIGRTEHHQAGKMPRCIMLALAAGIDRVFIYREKGSDPSMHAGAGLLRNDRSLRPSWFTTANLIRQLQGISGGALRLPHANPAVWMYLWRDGDRSVITGWTTGEVIPLGIELGSGVSCDAFGHPLDLKQGTSAITLSDFPTYFSLTKESPALTQLIAKASTVNAAARAAWKKLGDAPIALFDFGSDAHLGMLYTQGLPRRFAAVTKDTVWNAAVGYGFTKPALSNEDAHWVPDPLTRDGCKVDPSTAFRMRLSPGIHLLQVYAEGLGKPSIAVLVTAADGTTKTLTTNDKTHLIDLPIEGGNEPIVISLKDYGVIRWITAIGISKESGK